MLLYIKIKKRIDNNNICNNVIFTQISLLDANENHFYTSTEVIDTYFI